MSEAAVAGGHSAHVVWVERVSAARVLGRLARQPLNRSICRANEKGLPDHSRNRPAASLLNPQTLHRMGGGVKNEQSRASCRATRVLRGVVLRAAIIGLRGGVPCIRSLRFGGENRACAIDHGAVGATWRRGGRTTSRGSSAGEPRSLCDCFRFAHGRRRAGRPTAGGI